MASMYYTGIEWIIEYVPFNDLIGSGICMYVCMYVYIYVCMYGDWDNDYVKYMYIYASSAIG